jgi:hypothetical protein
MSGESSGGGDAHGGRPFEISSALPAFTFHSLLLPG